MIEKKKNYLKQFENIQDLPTLPAIVSTINQMIDKPDTTINSLSRVIEKDQAIVFKMLLLVNSAFFGFREKISSVNEAAIILGFDAIRNIVISISTFKTLNALSKKKPHDVFKPDAFWMHSVGVAVLSKYLSEKTKCGNPEKCFVSGLLHDMAKLVLAYYFPRDFKAIVELSRSEKLIYRQAELKCIPVGHNEIAYFIAKKWALPGPVANAIFSHHSPQAGASAFEESIIVNASDAIINSYYPDFLNNNTRPGRINYRYIEKTTQKKMRLWLTATEKWFPEVDEMILEAKKVFFEN